VTDPYNSGKKRDPDPWRGEREKRDRRRETNASPIIQRKTIIDSAGISVTYGIELYRKNYSVVRQDSHGGWRYVSGGKHIGFDKARNLFASLTIQPRGQNPNKRPEVLLIERRAGKVIMQRIKNPIDIMTALNAAGDLAMIKEFSDEKRAGAFKVRRKNPYGEGHCPPHLKKFRFKKVK
jgi:hypothetical protein